MFKKLLIGFIVLCLTGITFAGDTTFWALGEQSLIEPSDGILLRLGYEADNKEVGIQTNYFPSVEPEMPEIYGFYGLVFLSEPVEVNNPISIEFLPEKVSADVYFGGQVTMDFGEDDVGSYSGLLAGAIINETLVIEYQYNRLGDELAIALEPDSHSVFLGLRVKF